MYAVRFAFALLATSLLVAVGSTAPTTDTSKLIPYDKIDWSLVPASPPANDTVALEAARDAVRAAFKGTVLEPILNGSSNSSSLFENGVVTPDWNGYQCETTTGSPWATDVLVAAHYLEKDNRLMCHNNPLATCTQLSTWGNAAIGLCGWPRRADIQCHYYGSEMAKLVNFCTYNGRIGGKVWWDGYTNQKVPFVVQAYRHY